MKDPNYIHKARVAARELSHADAMVIQANITGWGISKILMDLGNLADIIFVNAFDQMRRSRSQLQPSVSPLIGF
jgi:hypothetical protein